MLNFEFKKYPSIENHYQELWIDKALSWKPELAKMKYVLTEKIHGANVQVAFFSIPGQNSVKIILGRRKEWITREEKFFGIYDAFNSLVNAKKFNIEPFTQLAVRSGVIVRIYGEFFGDGIQKGVEYDPGKKFRFYDISIDDVMMTSYEFFKFMRESCNDALCAPIRGMADSLAEALAYDVEKCITVLGPHKDENFAEGIVIKPYNEVIELPDGNPFAIKKKHPKFKEKQSAPKIRKELGEEITQLRDAFMGYVNENRLDAVISKEGPITDKKEIGKYVKLLIEDAREDFLKDYAEDLKEVNVSDLKQVFNLGGQPANLILRKL